MATNWREEYFAALGVRDGREKANAALYDACMVIYYYLLLL